MLSSVILLELGTVTKALKDVLYAENLVTGNTVPGLKDDIKEEIESGNIEIEGVGEACDHEAYWDAGNIEIYGHDASDNIYYGTIYNDYSTTTLNGVLYSYCPGQIYMYKYNRYI